MIIIPNERLVARASRWHPAGLCAPGTWAPMLVAWRATVPVHWCGMPVPAAASREAPSPWRSGRRGRRTGRRRSVRAAASGTGPSAGDLQTVRDLGRRSPGLQPRPEGFGEPAALLAGQAGKYTELPPGDLVGERAVRDTHAALYGRGDVHDHMEVTAVLRSGRYSHEELIGLTLPGTVCHPAHVTSTTVTTSAALSIWNWTNPTLPKMAHRSCSRSAGNVLSGSYGLAATSARVSISASSALLGNPQAGRVPAPRAPRDMPRVYRLRCAAATFSAQNAPASSRGRP
jgi:hypothetical protein